MGTSIFICATDPLAPRVPARQALLQLLEYARCALSSSFNILPKSDVIFRGVFFDRPLVLLDDFLKITH